MEKFLEFQGYIQDVDLKYGTELGKLILDNQELIYYLCHDGYFTAPASTKYHGAYDGGLFDHSMNVACRLTDITDRMDLHWSRPESPFIIGLFHDLCKCDQYVKLGSATVYDEIMLQDGVCYVHNKETLLNGHGDKSVMILARFMQLTEEEVLCIRYHMGAYEKDDWQGFDLAIRKYPNVLFTHTADQLASKVDEE